MDSIVELGGELIFLIVVVNGGPKCRFGSVCRTIQRLCYEIVRSLQLEVYYIRYVVLFVDGIGGFVLDGETPD